MAGQFWIDPEIAGLEGEGTPAVVPLQIAAGLAGGVAAEVSTAAAERVAVLEAQLDGLGDGWYPIRRRRIMAELAPLTAIADLAADGADAWGVPFEPADDWGGDEGWEG